MEPARPGSPISAFLVRVWRLFSGADTAGVAATNGLIAVQNFASGIIAARLLGQVGRGQLAAIQIWPMFLSLFAFLGTNEAIIYYGAANPRNARGYLVSAMALALAADLPLVLLGYLLMPTLLSSQSPEVVAAARWYLAFLFVIALWGLPHAGLRAVGAFRPWNGVRLLPGAGLILVLACAWVLKLPDPRVVALGFLAFNVLMIAPVAYTARRHIPGSNRPDVAMWRPMLAYGIPCVFSTVPQLLNRRLDQLIIAGLLPARELGLYAVAVAWSWASAPVLSAIAAVLFPRLASEPDFGVRAANFARAIRLSVVLAVLIAVVLLLATPVAVPFLFGKAFSASVPCAIVLVAAGVVAAFNTVLEEGVRGLGFPGAAAWAEGFGLVVTAAALALLLRPFGIMGAAIASLLAYASVSAVLLVLTHAKAGTGAAELLVPRMSEIAQQLGRVRRAVRSLL